MNNLVETNIQKLFLLIGGVLVFISLTDKELFLALGFAVLTWVVLVVTRNFHPSKRLIISVIFSIIFLILLLVGYVWYGENKKEKLFESDSKNQTINTIGMVDVQKLELKNFSFESTPDRYNKGNRYTIKGSVKNDNEYPVRKIIVRLEFFNRDGNKIDQHDEELTNTVYGHGEVSFEEKFDLYAVEPNSGYTYKFAIVDGKK